MITNTTILIGKEPSHARLLIAVFAGGHIKTATMGEIGSVPNCVSRCFPDENVAHCKIVVDQQGSMVLSNLKPRNVTYVNNLEIVTKRIQKGCSIALGGDKFPIHLDEVLAVVEKILQEMPQPPKEYNTDGLEKVWRDFQAAQRRIQQRQKRINLLSRIPMIFALTGSLLIGLGGQEIRPYSIVFTIIAAMIMIYGFYKVATDPTIEDRDRATKEFQRRYVCPNPECRHFLGNTPYEILIQDKSCRYCKCKWVQKEK